jgi:hypothetical protein
MHQDVLNGGDDGNIYSRSTHEPDPAAPGAHVLVEPARVGLANAWRSRVALIRAAEITSATPADAPIPQSSRKRRAMTGAVCIPLPTLAPSSEREQRPDRFVELLDCLADLLVETASQCQRITASHVSEDPRAREAAARLAEVERSLGELSLEAASVHQLLQHLRLI